MFHELQELIETAKVILFQKIYKQLYKLVQSIGLEMQPRTSEGSFNISLQEGIQNNDLRVDYSLMTEAERQAEFRRQHQQYITQKMSRKKQLLKQRKQQFGQSSSDQSDDDDDPIRSQSSDSYQSQAKNKSHDQQQKAEQNKQNTNKMQDPIEKIPINSLKKGGEWMKDVLIFQNQIISILDTSYPIRTLNKVKILSQITQGYPFRIKISYENQQILFSPALGSNQQKNGLLINYYTFARIIQDRLLLNGIVLRQAKQQKIPSVPESIIYNSLIYGRLNKKSQVLGKWQERFIVINKEGLYSYKKFNEKYTMHIPNGGIKQLWTRFQVLQQMLTIKIMHNKRKTQFGIPLTQMLRKNCWLYQFFIIMNSNLSQSQNNGHIHNQKK